MIWHVMAWYDIVWCAIVQYSIVWHGMHIIVRRIQGTAIRPMQANNKYDMYPSALRALASMGLLPSLIPG